MTAIFWRPETTASASSTARLNPFKQSNLKRRKPRTYPHREPAGSQRGWVNIRWKSRVRIPWNSTLKRYADHLRGERASLCADQHASLFLNQYGRPFAQDGKAIEAIVRKIGQRIGVPIHPHMLRHTYATHTLSSLQRRGGRGRRTEPLVFLQQQLGHASLSTTMVYLHMVNDVADEAVLAYDAEICSWDEE
ncbi:tyrosine-type recombinase/integrase [Variovorax gossypii]